MALANYLPDVPAREVPHEKAVVADLKKHEIYDHRLQPMWSLDSFLQGAPWKVTYFRQRLGQNDPPKKLDPGASRSYQSYDLYKSYEMLVQSALSPSYRDKEHLTEVTGSALMYSFMVPNENDYFIAESNLARLGLFRITNVNRKTHEKESVYIIEYALEDQITPDHDLFVDIYKKVVNTYFFSKQRLIENKNPVLLETTYKVMQDLQWELRNIYAMYFRDFFNVQTHSLQLPGQEGRHVDPLVINFITQIVSVYEAPMIERMRFLSLDNDPVYNTPTIWSLLLSRRYSELNYLAKDMRKYNPKTLYSAYYGRSGHFANADFILKMKDSDKTVGSFSYQRTKDFVEEPIVDFELKPTTDVNGNTVNYEEMVYTNLPEPLPLFKPVQMNPYIFSESFYQGSPTTVLEVLVKDYLTKSPIEPHMLAQVVMSYPKLARMEQFYYGPILMVLIKENERSAYA